MFVQYFKCPTIFRFSKARCAKALPVAIAAYKEGLQSHYLEEYHNAKVDFIKTEC